jgi:hypothetical protein
MMSGTPGRQGEARVPFQTGEQAKMDDTELCDHGWAQGEEEEQAPVEPEGAGVMEGTNTELGAH